ncbi:TPA: hypothetical protein N0F65_003656 [Lagenidium giganteum]|uniref:Uncharacterized protein n=1 Tax=Lagenidium giganteum TaxID=4803 RepID=A0AAV2YJ83_9STRA|nr:TPA: hypothetical protein N0F65_003656 [Lagenidium giganteum]
MTWLHCEEDTVILPLEPLGVVGGMEFAREARGHVGAGKVALSGSSSPHDEQERLALAMRNVDSTSSLNSTVYDEEEQQLHRPGAAPPNLSFEASNFFRFGSGSDVFASMSKYDDPLGADEYTPETAPSVKSSGMLPPRTVSPSNQLSHDDRASGRSSHADYQMYDNKAQRSNALVNRRKNSIEMFLSQSPSQALGGDILRLTLEDPPTHFSLDAGPKFPKKFGMVGQARHQQEQARFGGGSAPNGPRQSQSQAMRSGNPGYSGYQQQSEESWSTHGHDGRHYRGNTYQEQQQHNAAMQQDYYGNQHGNFQPEAFGDYPQQQHMGAGASGYGYAVNQHHARAHVPQQQQQQWESSGLMQHHASGVYGDLSGGRGSGYHGDHPNQQMHQMHYQAPLPIAVRGVPVRPRVMYGRMEASPPLSPRKSLQGGGMPKQCRYFAQGHCRMGTKCRFVHQAPQSLHAAMAMGMGASMPSSSAPLYSQTMQLDAPQHQLVQSSDETRHSASQYGGARQGRAQYRAPDGTANMAISPRIAALMVNRDTTTSLESAITVDDIRGRVFMVSKDQNGCRLLQEQLDYEQRTDLSEVIYKESLEHLAEMMVDPFGNYLFQKLLERVKEKERLEIIQRVSSNLVAAALNLHGTRSVQKVVEVCATSPEVVVHDEAGKETQRVNLPDMIVEALKDDAVRLCIDSNGNHVIQRALQYMKPEYNQFVFDAVSRECTTVGTHRHGCCVLQRCLDAASPEQKRNVIAQVEKQAMKLMQDPYGNYVVQYVLDSCTPDEALGVISKPLGHIFELSVQKFSSNVIEKCLEKAPERVRQKYVKEITLCPKMGKMLQDQFANYVVQRALCVCTEEQCLALVKAIRPHLVAMKNTSGGRRIMARIIKRFPNINMSLDTVGGPDDNDDCVDFFSMGSDAELALLTESRLTRDIMQFTSDDRVQTSPDLTAP